MPVCQLCGTAFSPSGDASVRCVTCGSYLPKAGTERNAPVETVALQASQGVGEPADQPKGPPPELTPADLIRPRNISPEFARHVTEHWEATQSPFKHPQETLNSSSSATAEAEGLLIGTRSVANVAEGGPADYELTEVIGEGNMGTVWSARQASLNRHVAVKVPNEAAGKSKLGRDQFISEVVVTGQLDHPNIVPIYDLARDSSGQLLYSMKRIEGRPWNECMHDAKLALQDNMEILMKVCDAIRFAHDRGVIHRDIKPHNIMVGSYGEVSVMDWGIAVRLDADAPGGGVVKLSPAGTPAYMAPEMATHSTGEIGPATDVYLLGAVLYEIISGEPPHPPPTDSQDRMQLQRDALLIAARNEVKRLNKSGELVDIAYRALATDVSDRYQSVSEFQGAIRDYFSHAESIVLAERGAEHLHDALANGHGGNGQRAERFDDFDRARFAFEEAIKLWPENEAATKGLAETRLAYANFAYAEGDYGRGIALLDRQNPQHVPVLRKLTSARRRTRRTSTMLRLAAAVIVVGGALFTYRLMREKNRAVTAESEAVEQAKRAVAAESDAKLEAKRATLAEKAANVELIRATKAEETAEVEAKRATTAEMVAKVEAKRALAAEQDAREASYFVGIGLADRQLQRNDFAGARRILAPDPVSAPGSPTAIETVDSVKGEDDPVAPLRNWEWGYLSYQANLDSAASFSLSDNLPLRVESAAIWRNGQDQTIIAGTADGKVYVWSQDRNQRPVALDYGAPVHAIAVTGDGKWLAVGGGDESRVAGGSDQVKFWPLPVRDTDVPTPSNVQHSGAILSIEFSQNGSQLLTSGADGAAAIWRRDNIGQVESWQMSRVFWHQGPDEPQNQVWSSGFSPDENWIVTAGEDGLVRVWSTTRRVDKTEEKAAEIEADRFEGQGAPVYAAVFSPDGRTIVFGGGTGELLAGAFDPAAAVEALEKTGPNKRGSSPIAQRVQERLVTPPGAAGDPRVTLLGNHAAEIRDISFSADGNTLFSASHDNTVGVWDLSNGAAAARRLRTLRGHGGWVRTCVPSDDGRHVLSAGYDQQVRLWDWTTYEFPLALVPAADDDLSKLQFTSGAVSADGNWAATATTNGTVFIWDLHDPRNATFQKLQEGHDFQATTGIYFDNGVRLLTSGGDNTTLVWDAKRGNELLRIGGWNQTSGRGTGWRGVAAVAHNGQLIATGSDAQADDGAPSPLVRLWDAGSGQLQATLFAADAVATNETGQLEATALAFDSTDRLLFVGTQEGRCYLFHTDRPTPQRSIARHAGKVTAAKFLPDGRHLITAGTDGVAIRWELNANQVRKVGEFQHTDSVLAMDVSPDGQTLVTASGSSESGAIVQRWKIATGESLGSKELPEVEAKPVVVRSLSVDPDGTRALVTVFSSAGKSGHFVGEWDWSGGTDTYHDNYDRRLGDLASAVYSPTARNAVLTVGGRGARLQFANRKVAMSFRTQSNVSSISFSPDSRYLASAASDGSLKVWRLVDLRRWVPDSTLPGQPGSSLESVSFHPVDSNVLATAGSDGAIIWARDGDEWKGIPQLNADDNASRAVQQVEFSPNGDRLLTISAGGAFLSSGGRRPQPLPATDARCAAYSLDGDLIAIGDGRNVVVIDADTREKLGSVESVHSPAVTSIAFSPDRKRLFTAGADSTIKVFDTSYLSGPADSSGVSEEGKGQPLLTLEHDRVTSISLSRTGPDGRFGPFLLSTGLDGKAVLRPSESYGFAPSAVATSQQQNRDR